MNGDEMRELNELLAIDAGELTDAQELRLSELLIAKQKGLKSRREGKKLEYKALVSETVDTVFPSLEEASEVLGKLKSRVMQDFTAVIELKSELFRVRPGQNHHQFMNDAGNRRIKLGYYELDNYDDTVNEGVAKVKQYLEGLAKDEESASLVSAVMQLLSKDKAGNLKASRVLQLQKMADESGDASFMEGVDIIKDAYKPLRSKRYVRAEYKNETGAWVPVPLGITEVE